MANKYYDPSGYPQTGAPGSSAAMRSELATIATGFEGVEQDIDDALTGASGAVTTAQAAATAASGSATAAAGSATAASGSATAAANSASAAAATKLAVDATYDEFDDRYLGRKASDPTVDNDGGALQEGTLYFNTTTKTFKGYNGTAWINLPATSAASLTFSPTGNVSSTNVQAAIAELDTEKLSAGAGAVGTANLADGAVTGAKLESIISGGSVGSASQIPVITYDTKGRITAITFANVAAPTVLNGTNDSTFASTSGTQPTSPEWVLGYLNKIRFVSTQQSMTAGGLITVAHGLAAEPTKLFLKLICTTADSVNSVGDKLSIPIGVSEASSQSAGVTVRQDATNVYVRVGSGGLVLMNNSGSVYNITLSNYRMIVIAEL